MSEYFAARSPKDAVGIISARAADWYSYQNYNGILDKARASWRAYHGAYYDAVGFSHQLGHAGEQGELTQLAVNHYRNIAHHLVVMTTSTRPSMQARATNTDYKSVIQTQLANGILDYYMRSKNIEDYIRKAVEQSVVTGVGYVKMGWNSHQGEIYAYDLDDNGEPDPSKPLYEGDVEFTNLSIFDVVYDSYREDHDHDWVITRVFKNKYDIAARYPEYKQKIEGMQTKSDLMSLSFMSTTGANETDLIPLYEFYHKRSDSLPEGRYMIYLDEDVILYDGPMPYSFLPVLRIAPSDIMGTPYGYTPMFDLLPLQESINALYSTILTNQAQFGVQNVIVPRGSDITPKQVQGGLNFIEYNPLNGGKPEGLNLTQTPREIFDFIGILVKDMETLSGVNSVARGNPEASLRSGAALALVQSQALQYASNLQSQYIKLIESLGTNLVRMLQEFATAKRAIMLISGESNAPYVKEFSSDDLSNISRVLVDVGNPLARTTSGKLEIAQSLLQYQLLQDPQQYFDILSTGNLNAATDGVQVQLNLIRQENQQLMSGDEVLANLTDSHRQHIMHHREVLANPDLRKDPELVTNVQNHIQEHIDLLRQTDPGLLALLGEQPLEPLMPQQGAMDGAPQDVMQTQVPQGLVPPEMMQSPQLQELQAVQGGALPEMVNIPKPATPPAPYNELPTTPQQAFEQKIR